MRVGWIPLVGQPPTGWLVAVLLSGMVESNRDRTEWKEWNDWNRMEWNGHQEWKPDHPERESARWPDALAQLGKFSATADSANQTKEALVQECFGTCPVLKSLADAGTT